MLYLMNALNFCKSQLAGLVGIDSSCKIACRNGDKKGIHGQVLRCVPFTVLQNYCDFHLQNRIRGGVGCMPVQLTFFFHSMPVVKLCLVMQLSATGIYSGKKKFSVQKLNRNLCRLLSLTTFMFTTTLWIVKNKCAIVYVCV